MESPHQLSSPIIQQGHLTLADNHLRFRSDARYSFPAQIVGHKIVAEMTEHSLEVDTQRAWTATFSFGKLYGREFVGRCPSANDGRRKDY